MMCYYHPQAEGIVTCAKCGVPLCRECEANAFYRTENGSGQALCNKCSYNAAKETIDNYKSWFQKRKALLIVCSILIVIGLILGFVFYSNDATTGITSAAVLWGIAGFIMNYGNKPPKSVEEQIKDAVYEQNHPISHSIGKLIGAIIGYVFFAPILLVANFIGFVRTKSEYQKDYNVFKQIETALNQ